MRRLCWLESIGLFGLFTYCTGNWSKRTINSAVFMICLKSRLRRPLRSERDVFLSSTGRIALRVITDIHALSRMYQMVGWLFFLNFWKDRHLWVWVKCLSKHWTECREIWHVLHGRSCNNFVDPLGFSSGTATRMETSQLLEELPWSLA